MKQEIYQHLIDLEINQIYEYEDNIMYRRVPGGWVYIECMNLDSMENVVKYLTCFVPEPQIEQEIQIKLD